MEKVRITMNDGTVMLFPAEYAKKVHRKNELAHKANMLRIALKALCMADHLEAERSIRKELLKLSNQIIRLNRQIPPCGEVVR